MYSDHDNDRLESNDLLCFSHLRWNFVYQRPQHLLTRAAKRARVHFWEEPVFEEGASPALLLSQDASGVRVVTPTLPHGLSHDEIVHTLRDLLDGYCARHKMQTVITWYYTPMALPFSEHLQSDCTVYDCMDELSGFQGAPPELAELEQRMFSMADVVFTGGASLYAAKRLWHQNVHLFPSSVDYAHFSAARLPQPDPEDQAGIPHPRVGFYGVLDERLDRDLLRDVAAAHPEMAFILIGPVVKIQEETLPRASNIHYLGKKDYRDLPSYLAHWDVAMLPFAQNASTRFISPTKTPEYLAAGKPVVSTPIRDVVTPYADKGLVEIGGDAAAFGSAIDRALQKADPSWLSEVDRFLRSSSWDKTFRSMWQEVERILSQSNMKFRASAEQHSMGVESNV